MSDPKTPPSSKPVAEYVPDYAAQKAAPSSRVPKIMAFASVVAPLLMFVVDRLSGFASEQAVLTIDKTLVLGGILLAVMALFTAMRRKALGAVLIALIGLVLGLSFVIIYSLGRAISAGIPPGGTGSSASSPPAAVQPATVAAGWAGTTEVAGAKIVLAEASDSPAAFDLRVKLRKEISVAILDVDNTAGTAPVTVRSGSATVTFSDGATIKAMADSELEAMGRLTPKDLGPQFKSSWTVAAGARQSDSYVAFPVGTDFKRVVRVAVLINGQVTTIAGGVLAAAEKAKLFPPPTSAPATAPTAVH